MRSDIIITMLEHDPLCTVGSRQKYSAEKGNRAEGSGVAVISTGLVCRAGDGRGGDGPAYRVRFEIQ